MLPCGMTLECIPVACHVRAVWEGAIEAKQEESSFHLTY